MLLSSHYTKHKKRKKKERKRGGRKKSKKIFKENENNYYRTALFLSGEKRRDREGRGEESLRKEWEERELERVEERRGKPNHLSFKCGLANKCAATSETSVVIPEK